MTVEIFENSHLKNNKVRFSRNGVNETSSVVEGSSLLSMNNFLTKPIQSRNYKSNLNINALKGNTMKNNSNHSVSCDSDNQSFELEMTDISDSNSEKQDSDTDSVDSQLAAPIVTANSQSFETQMSTVESNTSLNLLTNPSSSELSLSSVSNGHHDRSDDFREIGSPRIFKSGLTLVQPPNEINVRVSPKVSSTKESDIRSINPNISIKLNLMTGQIINRLHILHTELSCVYWLHYFSFHG